MGKRLCLIVVFVWLGFPVAGESVKDYVGAQTCQGCHPEQFAQQSKSAHAHSLYRAREHPLVDSFATDHDLVRAGRFHFRFVLNSERLWVRAFDDQDFRDMVIEWAFGAGGQGVTFVSRGNESWYLEHSFSYYAAIQSLDVTPGHDHEPKTLEHAMGILYETRNPDGGIIGCFQCHSTGPVASGNGGVLRPLELGVRCEACHGPGRRHAEAVAAGRLQRAKGVIRNPKRLSAEQMNHFCGACHRRPTLGSNDEDLDDPWNTRHSAVYLSLSRCFKKSSGRLTCLNCHDPHLPLRRNDPVYYSQRCASCHEPASHPQGHFASAESADCTGCHMPTVRPHSHLAFHNHWIGVYRDGQNMRPTR